MVPLRATGVLRRSYSRPLPFSLYSRFCKSTEKEQTRVNALLDPRFKPENIVKEIRQGSISELSSLISDIKKFDIHIPPNVIHEIMKRICESNNSVNSAYKLLKETKLKTTDMYNTLLRKLETERHPTLTIQSLFSDLISRQLLPNEETLVIITKALLKSNQPTKAKNNLLKHYRKYDIGESPFLVLFQYYQRNQDCESMEELLHWMKSNEVSLSYKVYHEAIHTYTSAGRINEANELLEQARNIVQLSGNTYLVLLRFYTNHLLADEAVKLFEKLPEYGITPNSAFYNSIIDVLAKLGRSEEAEKYYDQLMKQKIPIRAFTAVNYRIKDGKHGLEFLRQLDAINCWYPKIFVFVVMAKLYSEKNYDLCKPLLFKLAALNTPQLNSHLLVYLKYLLNQKHSESEIAEILDEMVERGYCVSEELFVDLFDSYSYDDDLNTILSLLKLVYEYFIPTEDTYFSLFKHVIVREVEEDIHSFIDVVIDQKITFHGKQLVEIVELMESKNLELPQALQEMVILHEAIPAGKLSQAYELCMKENISLEVVQRLVDEFVNNKKFDEAEQLKVKYPDIDFAALDAAKQKENETKKIITDFAFKINPFRPLDNKDPLH